MSDEFEEIKSRYPMNGASTMRQSEADARRLLALIAEKDAELESLRTVAEREVQAAANWNNTLRQELAAKDAEIQKKEREIERLKEIIVQDPLHCIVPGAQTEVEKKLKAAQDCLGRVANRCRSKSWDSILQDVEEALWGEDQNLS